MEANSELKYIFSNINEWLKFAEAKHGGLIVLNAGIVFGILSSYASIQYIFLKPAVFMGVICFGLSVFLSILSQFPSRWIANFDKKTISTPNIYFFGHLSHFDPSALIEEFMKIDPSFAPSRLDKDLINQILINARTTKSKIVLFKVASFLTAFGSGIIGLSSIMKIIWHF